MSIKPNLYTNNICNKTFSSAEKVKHPYSIFEQEDNNFKVTPTIPEDKPNTLTKTWNFLSKNKKYLEGTLQGAYYGFKIGLPAAILGFATAKLRIFGSASITKSIMYPSALFGAYMGMKVIDPGDKDHGNNLGFWDRMVTLLKGCIYGLGFGLATGYSSSKIINSFTGKSAPIFKTILGISSLAGAVLGCLITAFSPSKELTEKYFTNKKEKDFLDKDLTKELL